MSFFHQIRKYSLLYFQFILLTPFFVFPLSAASNDHRFNSSNPFTTYLGGNNNEAAYAIALDSKHNIFIAGETNSVSFDSFSVTQDKFQFNQNCFVVKISSSSPIEDFYFEFAGSKRETCREIAIDEKDNLYLTGETQSNDLPVTTNRSFGGEWDAFLLKLSNTGDILYASYIGGNLTDYGHGLAIESVDNVYITGETWSTDFPTTSNAFMSDCKPYTSCNEDKNKSKSNIFVTHINTQNPTVFNSRYSTYLGGTNHDKAHDLAIDKNRHLHIVGETRSHDFPLVGDLIFNKTIKNNQSLNGTYDAFLAVINPHVLSTINENNSPASKSLVLSTYIGGSNNDFAFSVTTDKNNTSYIAGETWSDDFPATDNAFAKKCGTGILNCNQNNIFKNHSDAFIIAITHDQLNHNNTSSYVQYSTFIGGENIDSATDIFVDENLIYITGTTASNKFPITDNAKKTTCLPLNQCSDSNDGFIVAINTKNKPKQSLIYSAYIGGSGKDNINSFSFSSFNTSSLITSSLSTNSFSFGERDNMSNKNTSASLNNWPSNNFSSILMTGQTYSFDILKNETLQSSSLFLNNSFDTKIENGEAFIQQLFLNNSGNWVDQYPTSDKNLDSAAENSPDNSKPIMASSISGLLLVYIGLAIFFQRRKKLRLSINDKFPP